MSREIKFRAWHKEKKEMVYFDNEKASKDQFQSSAILRLMAGDDSGSLMQFTGLKDSAGKDIYEGDILNVLMSDWVGKSDDDTRTLMEYKNSLSNNYTVGFKNGSFMMSLNDKGELDSHIFCGEYGFIYVIGDIFES